MNKLSQLCPNINVLSQEARRVADINTINTILTFNNFQQNITCIIVTVFNEIRECC